jgi:hypothetical protein
MHLIIYKNGQNVEQNSKLCILFGYWYRISTTTNTIRYQYPRYRYGTGISISTALFPNTSVAISSELMIAVVNVQTIHAISLYMKKGWYP